MKMTTGMTSSNTDEWATPQDLFDALDATFHFTLDPCATPENAKCAKFYTKEQDGLKQDWGGCYMVQSAIWPRDWQMDSEMRRTQGSGCHANSGKNRHALVALIHRQESRCACLLHQRTAQVRKCEKLRTISVRACSFYELEH